MIDDDDVMDVALLWPSGGLFVTVLGMVIIAAMAWASCENSAACGRMTCPAGATPQLLDHACLCVSEAARKP